MSFQARLVIILIGLLFAAVGVALVGLFLEIIEVTGTALERWEGLAETGISGAVLLVVGLLILLLGISRRSKEKKIRSIIQYHETGEVQVALDAVENMVLRVARQQKGIRDTETQTDYISQGLLIYVKIKVLPDIQIPQLVSTLQQEIKEYVEEITGTSVAEVKVLVENVVTDQAVSRRK